MLAGRVFTRLTLIFVLCDNNTLLGATAVVDGVEQMNRILQHPGWTDLKPLKVVDQGKWCTVQNLLRSDIEEQNFQLVTEGNLQRKVRQAYTFLNCDYAIMFLTYIEYMYMIGNDCSWMDRKNTPSSEKRECLKMFRRLTDGNLLVLRMQSALAYLESLSPAGTTPLNNIFYKILKSFDHAYQTTPDSYWKQPTSTAAKKGYLCFVCSEANNEDVLYLKTDDTLILLKDLKDKTIEFFENHCDQTKYLTKSNDIESSTYSWSFLLLDKCYYDQSGPIDRVKKTYAIVNNVIKDFIVSDYTRMGFVFNAESNTTVLNRNPDTINKVQQTNEILTHIGWANHLGSNKIVMDKSEYSVEDLLATDANGHKANEDNVDTKMRLIYGFMSCDFVEVIKELLSYIKSLAILYDQVELTEKFKFFRYFVRITKKIDPVILYMRGVILYFQRLSPQTGFDIYILKIIRFLMNSIEMINYYQSGDYHPLSSLDTRSLNNEINKKLENFLSNLSAVEKELNTYTQASCVVPVDGNSNKKVPQDSQKRIVRQIDAKINSFLNIEYTNWGFSTTHYQALLPD